MDGETDGQMDGHGETRIPPYNFVVGGIIRNAAKTISLQTLFGRLNKFLIPEISRMHYVSLNLF
jgi:hypothetical protein